MADNKEEEYLDSLLNTYTNNENESDATESGNTADSDDNITEDSQSDTYENYTTQADPGDIKSDDLSESSIDVADLMSGLMDIVNNTNEDQTDYNYEKESEDEDSTVENDSDSDNSEAVVGLDTENSTSEDNQDNDISNIDDSPISNDDNSEPDSDLTSSNTNEDFDLSSLGLNTNTSEDADSDNADEAGDSDIFALEENMEENISEPEVGEDSDDISSAASETAYTEQSAVDAPKPKKKFSFKNLFKSKKKEPEVDAEETSADNNTEIINELYENTESLDSVAVEEPAKEKKVKEKKPKKVKEKKPKKEKPVKEKIPSDYMAIKPASIIRTVLFVVVVLAAVILGSRFTYYKISMHDARTYYNKGQYDLAYDKIAGLDIKSDDENFYYKLRVIMTVYNKYQAYSNYTELGRTADAVDSLIQGVGKYYEVSDNAEKYVVTDKVNAIYSNILKSLEKYDITEDMAVEYSEMTDYSQYSQILQKYGGNLESDSDN